MLEETNKVSKHKQTLKTSKKGVKKAPKKVDKNRSDRATTDLEFYLDEFIYQLNDYGYDPDRIFDLLINPPSPADPSVKEVERASDEIVAFARSLNPDRLYDFIVDSLRHYVPHYDDLYD